MSTLATVFQTLNQNPLFSVQLGPSDSDAGWFPFTDALEGPWLAQQFARYEADYPGLDRRGQGAFMVSRLSYVLSTVLVACDLSQSQIPTMHPAALSVKEEQGRLLLRVGKPAQVSSSPERIRQSIIELMTPVIEPVRVATQLTKTPQWRLVSDSVVAAFLMVGRRMQCERYAKERALSVLNDETTVLSNRHSGYTDVEVWVPDASGTPQRHRQTYRARGGCCRVFTSEHKGYCATCIHLKPDERLERLSTALREDILTQHRAVN